MVAFEAAASVVLHVRLSAFRPLVHCRPKREARPHHPSAATSLLGSGTAGKSMPVAYVEVVSDFELQAAVGHPFRRLSPLPPEQTLKLVQEISYVNQRLKLGW